jgi:hypothetical protein
MTTAPALQAKRDADPGDCLGREEFLRTHDRPVEGCSKDEIEIEQRKWRNEEIGLVELAELHGLDSSSFQQNDASQHHSQHEHDRQDREVSWHPITPHYNLTAMALRGQRDNRLAATAHHQERSRFPAGPARTRS